MTHAARHPRSTLCIPLPDASGRRLASLCRAVIDDPSAAIDFEQHAASVGASVRTPSCLFMRELGVPPSEFRPAGTLGLASESEA